MNLTPSVLPPQSGDLRKREFPECVETNLHEQDRGGKFNAAYRDDDRRFMRFLLPLLLKEKMPEAVRRLIAFRTMVVLERVDSWTSAIHAHPVRGIQFGDPVARVHSVRPALFAVSDFRFRRISVVDAAPD